MLFYTPEFLVFSLLLAAALLVSQQATYRKAMLLLFSWVFYMWWNPVFIVLILYSTALNYLVGLKYDPSPGKERRNKYFLVGALVLNLGLLGYFKYFGFFQENLLWLMRHFGREPSWTTVHIVLPVGISFYTFQAMSYTVDVYRGKIPICRSPLDFALFIAFFAQLVAGPIVRASEFLPQLRDDIRMRFTEADFWLILKGLFKKVAIADNVGHFVDYVFAHHERMPSLLVWLGAIGFTIQIYCDFSGYTDMAIGVGRVFGFRLPLNFERPFQSGSISEFWRGWHMSLSRWIDDYLYTPVVLALRGYGTAGIVAAILFTFALLGLWHGANWTFVVFGLLHGAAVAGELPTRKIRKRIRKRMNERLHRVLTNATTMIYVFMAFIVFRAPDLSTAWSMCQRYVLFDFDVSIADIGLGNAALFSTLALVGLFVALHSFSYTRGTVETWLVESPTWLKTTFAAVTGLFLVLLWPLQEAPFIYFQF